MAKRKRKPKTERYVQPELSKELPSGEKLKLYTTGEQRRISEKIPDYIKEWFLQGEHIYKVTGGKEGIPPEKGFDVYEAYLRKQNRIKKEYTQYLAKKFGIQLDLEHPFSLGLKGSDDPMGKFPGSGRYNKAMGKIDSFLKGFAHLTGTPENWRASASYFVAGLESELTDLDKLKIQQSFTSGDQLDVTSGILAERSFLNDLKKSGIDIGDEEPELKRILHQIDSNEIVRRADKHKKPEGTYSADERLGGQRLSQRVDKLPTVWEPETTIKSTPETPTTTKPTEVVSYQKEFVPKATSTEDAKMLKEWMKDQDVDGRYRTQVTEVGRPLGGLPSKINLTGRLLKGLPVPIIGAAMSELDVAQRQEDYNRSGNIVDKTQLGIANIGKAGEYLSSYSAAAMPAVAEDPYAVIPAAGMVVGEGIGVVSELANTTIDLGEAVYNAGQDLVNWLTKEEN